jgi:hypothetical protein
MRPKPPLRATYFARSIVLLLFLDALLSYGPSLHAQKRKSKSVKQPKNYTVTYRRVESYTPAKEDQPGEDFSAVLPLFKTKDRFIRSLVDSFGNSISDQWSIPNHSLRKSKRKSISPATIDDIPFETHITSHVSGNDSLLSIFVHIYEHGCCGASGSAESWRTLNADLRANKVLTLTDILLPGQREGFINEVKSQLADTPIPAEFEFSNGMTDFRIDPEGIELFVSVSDGGRTWYETAFIRFRDHRVFRDDIVRNALLLNKL